MADEPLLIVPVPSLVAVLLNRERAKGSPLTEMEVLEIRDGTACVAMPLSAKEHVDAERGYVDIDPERAWDAWQEIRLTLL